jgi:hypothetical protein
MIQEVTELFEQLGAQISINGEHVWAVRKTVQGKCFRFSVYTDQRVFNAQIVDDENLSLDLFNVQGFHDFSGLASLIKNNRLIAKAFPQWIQGSILNRYTAVS